MSLPIKAGKEILERVGSNQKQNSQSNFRGGARAREIVSECVVAREHRICLFFFFFMIYFLVLLNGILYRRLYQLVHFTVYVMLYLFFKIIFFRLAPPDSGCFLRKKAHSSESVAN